jgi:hypothetical protein
MKYPDIGKGARWGTSVGGVFGFACLAMFYWLSKQPQTSDVSFAPMRWWEVSKLALFVFVITSLPIGILIAFRPSFRARKRLDTNDT